MVSRTGADPTARRTVREMHEQADRENVAAPAMNLREEHLLLASREEMEVDLDFWFPQYRMQR